MLPVVTVALNAPPLVGESWCLAASRDVCAGQMASLATVIDWGADEELVCMTRMATMTFSQQKLDLKR